MATMIRINVLARELEVPASQVLQALEHIANPEGKTHASSVDETTAGKIRGYFIDARQRMARLKQDDAFLVSQKNAVFREIEAKGLDPRHFRWTWRVSGQSLPHDPL